MGKKGYRERERERERERAFRTDQNRLPQVLQFDLPLAELTKHFGCSRIRKKT
jgi:hypothetical protein